MSKSSAEFSLVIGAVDKFTGPFKKFGSTMDQGAGKLKKLGAEFRAFKKASGFLQTKAALNGLGQGLAKVGSEASRLVGRVRGLAGALGLFGLAGGGVAGGLFKMSKDFAEAGGQADEMAQKLGLTAQQWQSMAYAAKVNGVAANDLQTSYEKLNQTLIGAAKGGKAQIGIFKELGVSTKSLTEPGKLKATDVLMTEVAEAFAKMEDGARKATLANQLFGQAGVKLLPLFNKGQAGLAELRAEAERLGLVFDDQAVLAGAAFGEGLTRLGEKFQGLKYIVGQAFLPAAAGLVEVLGDLIEQNRALIKTKVAEWAGKLVKALPTLKNEFLKFAGALPGAIKKVDGLAQSLGGWANVAKIAGAVMAGPLVKAILGLVGPLKTLGIAIMTTPVGLVLGLAAAFAGLMAEAGALQPFLGGVKEGFAGLSGGLSGAFVELVKSLGSAFGDIGDSLFKVNGEIDAEAWKRLGAAVGEFAGGALGTLIMALTEVVKLFKSVGDWLGSTAGMLDTGVDVNLQEQVNKMRAQLNADVQKAYDSKGYLSDQDKANVAARQKRIESMEWGANNAKTSAVFGRPDQWQDLGSGILDFLGFNNKPAPVVAGGRGVAPGLMPRRPTLGPPAMSDGLVQTMVEKTEHTEVQRAEVNVKVQALPGATASVTSSGLPNNAKVSGGDSLIGVSNSGG
ncbi:hypothetical protein LJB86_02675 [Deltaproteobacteria bacterium OttesenSCG-928-M10]|nr:hypothetical protein [Deltaproteobacteria bacterium OttesenSCG-928-M10]